MIPTLYYKVYKMNMSDYSQLNNGDKVTVTLMNHDILTGTFVWFDQENDKFLINKLIVDEKILPINLALS